MKTTQSPARFSSSFAGGADFMGVVMAKKKRKPRLSPEKKLSQLIKEGHEKQLKKVVRAAYELGKLDQ